MDRKIKITLKITDEHTLSFVVDSPEQEALYRRSAKDVYETIMNYRSKYPNNTLDEFLSMTAFLFALKCREMKENDRVGRLEGEIQTLTARLTEYLNKEN